jgi:glycolate oxidase
MQPLAAAGAPLAVLRPASTNEVAEIVRACAREGIPVVPRGAGSGMTGAGNAVDGGVSIVLTRMNRILEIDETARLAVVQPGVVTSDLKLAVGERGLFYAPDPTSSSWCTIGGNLANGSAGPCGSKYGTTADAVLALEVVLASGEVLRTGRKTLKGVSGYDLNRLFVGSEGTLGIITEATLALRAKPASPATCVAVFEGAQAAVDAVTEFLAGGHNLSLLELMDQPCVAAVEESLGTSLLDGAGTPAAVLFGQSDSGRSDDLDAFEASCLNNGATFAYQTADAAEGEMLMQYWHGLEAALEAKGQWIVDPS